MGIVQKDALRTTAISYAGLVLGYVNKAVLMIIFLNTEEIGLVNLLLGIGLLFGQATNFGSIYATAKFFPFFENKERNNYGFLGMMLAICSLGILILAGLFIWFQPEIASFYEDKSARFNDYALWVIPVGMSYVLYSLFEVYLRGLYINIISVFSYEFILRLLVSTVIFAYGMDWLDFDTFIALHCYVYFVPPIILIWYLISIGEFKIHPKYWAISKRFRKIIVYFSLYSYFNTLGALAVVTIDAVMVSSMIGLEATGIYTTVVYLTSALQAPYRSIIRVSVPLVAKHWKDKNIREMNKLYKQVSSVSLFIGFYLFAGVWVNRTEIFALLPEEYLPGIWLFFILMIGKLFDMYFGVNGTILNSSKKYKVDLIFTTILLFGVYALNQYLIPIYGVNGAAWSTTITVVLYNLLRTAYIYFAYQLNPFERSQLFVILLFSFAMLVNEWMPFSSQFNVFNILLKTTVMTLLTVGPIYFFRIEKNSADYIDRVLIRLKLKN